MDANVLENYKEIAGQNVGAALVVVGQVVLTPGAKQPLEVKAASIAVEGPSAPDYPLQKKRHGVEFLRTIQHLSLIHIFSFFSGSAPSVGTASPSGSPFWGSWGWGSCSNSSAIGQPPLGVCQHYTRSGGKMLTNAQRRLPLSLIHIFRRSWSGQSAS